MPESMSITHSAIPMKATTILDTIGNTPLLRLNRLFANRPVWMKLERANPGVSKPNETACSAPIA